MSFALDIVTITAVSAGAFFFLAGTVGLLRFPDALTRLHALTKADNLGLGLVVLGLLPQAGSVRGGLKLVCVWLLVLLAGAWQLRTIGVERSGAMFSMRLSSQPRGTWREPGIEPWANSSSSRTSMSSGG